MIQLQIVLASPWVPIEWIKAHGHEPRGAWFSRPESEAALPEGLCAFACWMKGLAASNPDGASVFTTACDQMRRAADAVIASSNSPHTFLFNLPATWQSKAARTLYHAELARLGRFLERLGGPSPSNDHLREVIRESDARRKALLHILPQCSTRVLQEAMATYYSGGDLPMPGQGRRQATPDPASQHHSPRVPGFQPRNTPSTLQLKSLPGSAEASNAWRANIPLALVGGPLASVQSTLFDTIEAAGGRVVLNATEPGERTLPPPLGDPPPTGDLRTVLADHYFDHIVDVFQRPNSRLYSWLGPRLRARQVRGILLWIHVGCDLWRAEAQSLREAFRLPLLALESHEVQCIGPREAHRVEAFIESLR